MACGWFWSNDRLDFLALTSWTLTPIGRKGLVRALVDCWGEKVDLVDAFFSASLNPCRGFVWVP